MEGAATAAGSVGSFAGCDCAGRREVKLEAIKRPKEVSLGEHTSLGPKATAPITVICLSPDLTLGVSSRTYSGMDTRDGAIKFLLRHGRAFVKSRPSCRDSPGVPIFALLASLALGFVPRHDMAADVRPDDFAA